MVRIPMVRDAIILLGVFVIAAVFFMSSYRERFEADFDRFTNTLTANIPPPTKSSSRCDKAEIIRELTKAIDDQIENHCPSVEGFTTMEGYSEQEAELNEELLEQLDTIRQQIVNIHPSKIYCKERYRPIMEALEMLDPDYELDIQFKNELATFLHHYFEKVLHMNRELHGLENEDLCGMVDANENDPSDEESQAKELIMQKFLDLLTNVSEVIHLKQNRDNNKKTRKRLRDDRRRIYKEFRAKVAAIIREHQARFRRFYVPRFKNPFRRFVRRRRRRFRW